MKRLAVLGSVLAMTCAMGSEALAEVKAHVGQISMKLTEQNVTDVHLGGTVSNHEVLPVRGVQVTISLLSPDNKLVRSFLLDPVEHLQPGQQASFNADYVLREYENDPLYLKAKAEVKYVSTSNIQIADWLISQNWGNLSLWQIPVSDEAKYTERGRLEAALGWLERVDRRAPDHEDARRKWNLIHYTYGLRLANAAYPSCDEDAGKCPVNADKGHEAILRLTNVETNSNHYGEADQLLKAIRPRTIYERALQKAAAGNLKGAYRQMLYVPADSAWNKQAQAKRAEWLKTLKEQKVWLGAIDPPAHLSADQRAVWLRRQHGPEGYTTSTRNGHKLTTWWYLDYAYYTFDEHGRMLNERTQY